MSRTFSLIAVAALMLSSATTSAAQTSTSGKRQERMTLVLRRPAWFGFALDCNDCNKTRTSTGMTRTRPVITRVLPGSPAARASLAVGDTIVAVDGKEVTTTELRSQLEGLRGGVTLQFALGTRAGRKTVALRADEGDLEVLGPDSLPVRYRGEYAEVTVDVLSMSAPIVTRDSTGAMTIKVGDHVFRLHRAP